MSDRPDFATVSEALNGGDADQRDIAEQVLALGAMLLRKNMAYGNSALDPVRIFARGLTPLDLLHARMDDKLSRLVRGSADGEDIVLDLAGYAILELIARKRAAQ